MEGQPPFRIGDIVRLVTGASAIQVLEVDYFDCASQSTTPRYYARDYGKRPRKGWFIRFGYASSMRYKSDEDHRRWREASDFTFLNPEQKEPIMALFQTKEAKPRFGTLLTKNSKGKMVLEMKGRDGEVEAFDADQIEEVLPYTVHMRRFHGGESNAESRHYEMVEGSVAVGDVLLQLSNVTLWEVSELNTKNKAPTATKNGFMKLEGKRL